MTDCVGWHELKFCKYEDIYILGNYSEEPKNGILEGKDYSDVIVIPPFVSGHEIKEIGKYSLCECVNVKEIIIEARITRIQRHAMFECTNLVKIKLPNTLKYIDSFAIDIWNRSIVNNKNPGVTEVFFEPNSQLSHIDSHGLSYRERFIVYLCNPINATVDTNAFAKVNYLEIRSPYSFKSLGKRTITSNYSSICTITKKFTCKRKREIISARIGLITALLIS